MSHEVVLKNVVKRFGDFTAVNKANFTVNKGEFFTLLGPSGCGKTTLLRMIAGFNPIDEGEILFNGKVINHIPAHKRNTGMVFQNYAIFPHLSVFDNVAYGLRARKVPTAEMKKRVEESLDMVQMLEYKDRQPSQLSGGQQQRVALARAIVIHPRVLLMDEPLSNLDAKLRVQMRTTIKKLQHQLGITTIYVTHDQSEALAISDRIAVMKQGEIQQIGDPKDIYKHPRNSFVANFIGTSNFIDGKVLGKDDEGNSVISVLENNQIKIPLRKDYTGDVILSARPEGIMLTEDTQGIRGKVVIGIFLGDLINYEIKLKNGQIIEVNEYTKDLPRIWDIGDDVGIKFNTKMLNIFDKTGQEALL